MSDVFSTVLSGTAVYVLGQMGLKLVLEPVRDLKTDNWYDLALAYRTQKRDLEPRHWAARRYRRNS